MLQAAQVHDPRLTRNQSLVLSVLEASGQPLSAYGILDRLREHGLKAPLQVYRALDKLLEIGRVHRLESMNAFVVCCHSLHRQLHPRITAFEICETAARSANSTTKRSRAPWRGTPEAAASRSGPP